MPKNGKQNGPVQEKRVPAPARDDSDRGGEPGRGGGSPAYATSPQASTQAEWGRSSPSGPAAPAWATADGPVGDPAEPSSPFARAKVAVAAEPDPDETPVADDSAISEDDEDIEGLGEIGVPVVERVLGGKVISEEDA